MNISREQLVAQPTYARTEVRATQILILTDSASIKIHQQHEALLHMSVQSEDGAVEVSVLSPTPVGIVARDGERVRVAGVMLPTGSTSTLMLPMGPEVATSVALCSQKVHARQLTQDHGHMYGQGGGQGDSPECMCFYR